MFFKLVLFTYYLNSVSCSVTHYKASVVDVSKTDVSADNYDSLILEAAAANVDLLVLSSTKPGSETFNSCVNNLDNYDEIVKVISRAAKSAGIYVVAPVYEKIRCHYRDEIVFNNMVFDRDGGIVAAYRTPVSTVSKCNATDSNINKFTTDFGVTFALVTEEDIVLHRIEYFEGIKNFIVFGLASNIPNLFAEQFTSSWSFVNNVNIISLSGLFGANMDILDNLITAEFQKSGGSSSLVTASSAHGGFHNLYLNTKPLNTEASKQGFTETVCDGSLCCNFFVKISTIAPSVQYRLCALSELVTVGQRAVSLQACAVSTTQGRDVTFDKITITANFDKGTKQFPLVATVEPAVITNLLLDNNVAELSDANILTFGVLSRDYTNDNGIELQNKTNREDSYISYENVNDFFDYLWIRVRVLMFIVSIYILEML